VRRMDDPSSSPCEPRPELPATGVAGVDAALAPLAALAELPVAEHAAVYDEVHRGLQDALADLDQA
jgi:hypothetical protein